MDTISISELKVAISTPLSLLCRKLSFGAHDSIIHYKHKLKPGWRK